VKKSELEARNRQLEEQNLWLLWIAMDAMTGRKADAIEQVPQPKGEGKVRFELRRAEAASGGYVLRVFEYPGQSPFLTLFPLGVDDALWTVNEQIAMNRLRAAALSLWKESAA
jgi:hypothetical protein